MNPLDFGKALSQAALDRVGRVTSRLQEERPLASDVLESDEEYLVVLDAPGATATDVQVRYAGDKLHVQVDRFRDVREGFDLVLPGRGLALDGQVALPSDAAIATDEARAELHDDGTLYVYLPKVEGRDVEIQ